MRTSKHTGAWLMQPGLLFLAVLAAGGVASGQQQYSNYDALNILMQNDGGYCALQAGAWWPAAETGCCGAPGWRVCGQVLHAGKGPFGLSAGCTDPNANLDTGKLCDLPPVQPIPGNLLPAVRNPAKGTDIRFLVTSDLHFYRDSYNVGDQATHPYMMNQFTNAEAQAGRPYGAVMIVGDMTTGSVDDGFFNQDDRIGAYRLLYDNGWLPGASIGLPVFPTLGNHDSTSTTALSAQIWWNYLSALTQNMNADHNSTGCLKNIDPGCADQGTDGGSLNYSFDWEGVHFLFLNTWAGDTGNAYQTTYGSDGMTWLQNDLERFVGKSGRPVIVFQHYGMYDTLWGAPWWSDANMTSFESELANYNVVGWFSGHTHDLGVYGTYDSINQGNSNSTEGGHGVGSTLDNFMDGSGGDCQAHGDGKTKENTSPSDSTYCAHATANFFAVHVTDKTMEVQTVSWSDSKGLFDDDSIGTNQDVITSSTGMVGYDATGATGSKAGCVKRIGGRFQEVTSGVTLSVADGRVTVTNTTNNPIAGPLAIWPSDNSLTTWDFVDSCEASHAHKFVALTEGNLEAQGGLVVNYTGTASATPHLYRMADSLVLSQNSPILGTGPVQLTLTTASGNPVPFTIGAIVLNTPNWLHVATDSNTTPANLLLTADQMSSYTNDTKQAFAITAGAPGFAPLDVTVSILAPTLTLNTNAPGAKMVSGTTLTLPTTVTAPAGGGQVAVAVPSTTQYPSTGTRYTFHSWSDGLAASHDVTVPLDGLTLTANFDIAYQVSPTISGKGEVSIGPISADGYYPAGNIEIKYATQTGYYFVGYSGGLTGNALVTDFTLSGPLAFTATFAPIPVTTIDATHDPVNVTIDNSPQKTPMHESWLPGTSHTVSVPQVIAAGTGHQYVFTGWSDGSTDNPRNIVAGSSDTTVQAQYQEQFLISASVSPAGSGTIDGAGWWQSGSHVALLAVAGPGYAFSSFSGDLTAATSPQSFYLNAAMDVVGNFTPQSPQLNLNATVINDKDVDTVQISVSMNNSGLGAANLIRIDSATATTLGGTGTVTPKPGELPVAFPDLQGGQKSNPGVLGFLWPSTATRVKLVLHFTANGGAYQGSQTFTLFR